jgi:CRP-like cAMP-binding protein
LIPLKIDDFIATIPLFSGLPGTQLGELSKVVVNRTYQRGQMVFSEGDDANGFHVVLSGRVKVFKLSSEGKEQILHILEPGEPFGEVAVFAGKKFPANAETLAKSETLFFPRGPFTELIKKDPSLAMNMLALLSLRLKHFSRLVEDLSLKEVPQRLAAYLLYLSGRSNASDNVELDISKGQLASLLGTIPETLSRILNRLQTQEFLEVNGRHIRLKDRKALEALASGEKLIL